MQLNDLGMRDSFEAAWQKLLAASPAATRQNAEHVRQRIHIDGAGWHQSTESFPCLSTVQDAIWRERALFIRYQRGDASVERIVHPLGLVAKRSTWYFVAQVENDMRTYRISRLTEARMLEDSFVRPESFDLASYWEQSTADFQANLPRYPA
jgi:predicted DNA-binding transcriptional regulator YafY